MQSKVTIPLGELPCECGGTEKEPWGTASVMCVQCGVITNKVATVKRPWTIA